MISFGIYIVFTICMLGTTITGEFTAAEKQMFKKKMLKLHNEKRILHGVEKLKYSDELAAIAQILTLSGISDEKVESVGLSLFPWPKPNKDSKPSADDIFSEMYNSGKDYKYEVEPLKTDQKVPTAFTQIVWSGSKEIGMTIINGDDKCIIAIAYRPRGNEIGSFKNNVFRPKDSASSSSSKND